MRHTSEYTSHKYIAERVDNTQSWLRVGQEVARDNSTAGGLFSSTRGRVNKNLQIYFLFGIFPQTISLLFLYRFKSYTSRECVPEIIQKAKNQKEGKKSLSQQSAPYYAWLSHANNLLFRERERELFMHTVVCASAARDWAANNRTLAQIAEFAGLQRGTPGGGETST